MKKTILLFVSLLLLSVCSAQKNAPPATDPTVSQPIETSGEIIIPTEAPVATQDDGQPVQLEVLVADPYGTPDLPLNMDRPTMQKIRQVLLEEFNIDWSINSIPAYEFPERLTLYFAAATDLPDLIKYRLAPEQLISAYNSGLIIGLNELIDDYAPEVKFAFTVEAPYLTVANSTADGVILRIPQFVADVQEQVSVLTVRKDFCDKAGLELPKTTDDFYHMLAVFNQKDVNKSGRQDLIFYPDYASMNYSLGTAFGVYGASHAADSWWYDSNKKLYNSLLTDNAREYVSFVQKLYKQGYLADSFPHAGRVGSEEWLAAAFSNQIAATAGPGWWEDIRMNTALNPLDFNAEYVALPNLVKQEGDPSINILKNLGGLQGFMISKDCQRPDKAMQLINYGYTTEGTSLDYYGELYPGGDYYTVVDESRLDPRLQGRLSRQAMELTDKGLAEQARAANWQMFWFERGWNTGVLGQYIIRTPGDIVKENLTRYPAESFGFSVDIDWNLNLLDFFLNEGIPDVGFALPSNQQIEELGLFYDLFYPISGK